MSHQASAWDVLASGERSDDRRLGALRTLDTHCPFTPPASLVDWQHRAIELRRQLQVALGLLALPTRSPLNARVHGTIDCDGYVVDKVVFESIPGHFVTGNLYRPKGKPGRLAAVLSPHGHWPGGRFQDAGRKRRARRLRAGQSRSTQPRRIRSRRVPCTWPAWACVTFFYDMEGYADSVQIPRAVTHELKGARPQMHDAKAWGLYSPQAELHLQSVMGLQTWNSIRALDYLVSRDDVDAVPDRSDG